ncbi:hypothetical protein QYE76_052373 [Lolium multiflorum]|uniref:Uncharacterized protein n=1 Tax=Lolium multiflorum TaxID=4521 RepID=A0AAD8SUW6_LOLMU|nr:hypothetical protein QYE76_052373 [Lolium multiflorum]
MAEGRKFEYPETMTYDEIARLGVLVSEVDQPVQPPLPRYAICIMPPGLTEEEALQRALEASAMPPCSTAASTSIVQPVGASTSTIGVGCSTSTAGVGCSTSTTGLGCSTSTTGLGCFTSTTVGGTGVCSADSQLVVAGTGARRDRHDDENQFSNDHCAQMLKSLKLLFRGNEMIFIFGHYMEERKEESKEKEKDENKKERGGANGQRRRRYHRPAQAGAFGRGAAQAGLLSEMVQGIGAPHRYPDRGSTPARPEVPPTLGRSL